LKSLPGPSAGNSIFIEASNAAASGELLTSDILYVPGSFRVSSKHVLVIERIQGLRIDEFDQIDQAGFDRKELSRNGAAAFFQMVFQDGFFHADPHPGNIFVLADGKIGLVDFGIMGRVTDENMRYYADTIVALVEHDFDKLVQEYMNMGFVPDDVEDVDRFQRDLKEDLAECWSPTTA
jgi:ubiquinone biosynthesis protein